MFKCQVYTGFVERIPLYFQKYPERMPLYSNPQGHSETKFTIAQMIDRFHKKEHFSILRAEDVVLITNYISAYLREIGPMIEKIEDPQDSSKRFVARAKAYLQELQTSRKRSKKVVDKQHGIAETQKGAHEILSQLSGAM